MYEPFYKSEDHKQSAMSRHQRARICEIMKRKQEYPLPSGRVLLLDDVFSELDAHRCRQLMEVLPQDMQIFISSAQPIEQEMLAGKVADVFEVTDGTIQRRVLDE